MLESGSLELRMKMFWETREGQRTIIFLHMKSRKLELFNKASRQLCVLYSQELATVKPKIKKWRKQLLVVLKSFPCAADWLLQRQLMHTLRACFSLLIFNQHPRKRTQASKTSQDVTRILISTTVTRHTLQLTGPPPIQYRFEWVVDARGRIEHLHCLCNADQRISVSTS